MNLMKHGRKWLSLAIMIGFALLILGMSFYLSLRDKLTGDWSTLCQILIGAVAASVAAFMGTNMAITKKAIEEGATPPEAG
jgi:hypothetical protein